MQQGDFFVTSQITPPEFEAYFEPYAQSNTPVLYLSFSSGLSSTYQSSEVALSAMRKKYPDWQADTFDTKCTCGGLGLMVLKAAEMLSAGCNRDELYQMLKFYREHMEHIFTVDDIEFLYKGGRVSRTTAVLGGMLNIKPVLDIKDGKIRAIEKVRGSKKVYSKMSDIINDRADDIASQTVSIGYCADREKFEAARDEIKAKTGFTDIIETYLGATISAHSGPGTIAFFFLNERYES